MFEAVAQRSSMRLTLGEGHESVLRMSLCSRRLFLPNPSRARHEHVVSEGQLPGNNQLSTPGEKSPHAVRRHGGYRIWHLTLLAQSKQLGGLLRIMGTQTAVLTQEPQNLSLFGRGLARCERRHRVSRADTHDQGRQR